MPVLCGAAFKNKGVQPLLDAIVDYLPSPEDVPPITGINPNKSEDDPDYLAERRADDAAPFSALAFKVTTDPYVGRLTFIRVYSGVMKTGASVFNPGRRRNERIGRLLKMHANKREEIKQVCAGDIAAAVGLKSVGTGDTICDPQHPIVLESMDFPSPVISLAIEPKTKADQEKLGQGSDEAHGGRPDVPGSDGRRDRASRGFRGWASCTWRSSSTGCNASSVWRRASADRRSPTRRP